MIQDPEPVPTSDPSPSHRPAKPVAQLAVGKRRIHLVDGNLHSVQQVGFDTGTPCGEPTEYRQGRDRFPVYRVNDGSLLLWKRCLRGGWLSRINHDIHLSSRRFIEEMELATRVRNCGIATSDVMAVATTPAFPGVRVEMLIRLETGVVTLLEFLGDTSNSDAARMRVLDEVAGTICRFHDAGFLHGDLNLMNILIDGAAPRAILVDLDPGGAGRIGNRLGNLQRLMRSMRKSQRAGLLSFEENECHRFLQTVTGGDQDLRGALEDATGCHRSSGEEEHR